MGVIGKKKKEKKKKAIQLYKQKENSNIHYPIIN